MMGSKYLHAMDNPDDKQDWEKLVIQLREYLEDPQIEAAFPNIDTSILYSDKTLNVNNKKANQLYRLISGKTLPSPLVKEDKENKFVVPNKPMYRIFEIDDIKELKGFSGNWYIQEKYDGMRIQIHKIDEQVKIYSFEGDDITSKCPEQVKIMKAKHFGDCILDGELLLFNK